MKPSKSQETLSSLFLVFVPVFVYSQHTFSTGFFTCLVLLHPRQTLCTRKADVDPRDITTGFSHFCQYQSSFTLDRPTDRQTHTHTHAERDPQYSRSMEDAGPGSCPISCLVLISVSSVSPLPSATSRICENSRSVSSELSLCSSSSPS